MQGRNGTVRNGSNLIPSFEDLCPVLYYFKTKKNSMDPNALYFNKILNG